MMSPTVQTIKSAREQGSGPTASRLKPTPEPGARNRQLPLKLPPAFHCTASMISSLTVRSFGDEDPLRLGRGDHSPSGSHRRGGRTTSASGAPRAAQGTDLGEFDRLGMRITFAFEQRRFRSLHRYASGGSARPDADVFIVDISSRQRMMPRPWADLWLRRCSRRSAVRGSAGSTRASTSSRSTALRSTG